MTLHSDLEGVALPSPPTPSSPLDFARWLHTGLRWRMLYGSWRSDLEDRIGLLIGNVRREAWGHPDLSSCTFRSVVMQLAVLYGKPPAIKHDDTDTDEFAKIIADTGLWQLMQRFQRDCLGLREMVMRIEAVPGGGIVFRPVPPHLVLADASEGDPDTPIVYREAVLRKRHNGARVWTYDVFDISDPASPVHRITSADTKAKDLSSEFLRTPDGAPAPDGGLVGDAYWWRNAAGEPYIPAVLYHAARTGMLFDPFEGRELVEGSLNAGVHWTFFAHVMRNSSWQQKYVANGLIAGASAESSGDQTRKGIVTDPATIMMIAQDGDATGPVSIGQWPAGVAPTEVLSAAASYERRTAIFGGMSPADLSRKQGDPRSAYAIIVSRSGQREAQQLFTPQFERGDSELLSKAAMILNKGTGATFPETGYRPVYRELPLSSEEQKAETDHLLALMAAGLMDKETAYQRKNPGTNAEDAAKALENIRRVNSKYN